ncbi:MAG: META domain-containing protein [Flavobacteriales bacterium]
MKKLFLMSVFSLLLFACGTQKTADVTSRDGLQNVNWVMVDDTGVVSVGEGENVKPLSIRFFSGKVDSYSAFLGCNTITGKISAGRYGDMKFFDGATTRKACPDMSYEKTFIEMIGKANKYQIIGEKLHFYRNDILLMTFEKEDVKKKERKEKHK